jgi:hypothetical protein
VALLRVVGRHGDCLLLPWKTNPVRRGPPDYADAHDFVLTLLDELRSINLDHPNTRLAIEEVKAILKGRPKSDR